MLVLSAGIGAALLLPYSSTGTVDADHAEPAESSQRSPHADPRLAEIRRITEPNGPVRVHQVATGADEPALVVGHPDRQEQIGVLAGDLAAATASITELWGSDWSRSPVVVIASTPAEFAALARVPDRLSGEVAAVSVADPFAPGARPTGQRVVFGPDTARRLDPAELRTLLRHELTHIATRAATVDGSPLWMLEGFAEYAAQRGTTRPFSTIAPTLAAELRTGSVPTDLPTDALFGGDRAATAYELAWSACAYLAEKYGEPRLVALYRRLATGARTPPGHDTVFREVLGTTRVATVAEWRAWLTARGH
ncbi:hypothetical protein [Nocardia brevicatena]|uniref:hypothetical protein n=1 Tax=Nocardia brevicatena TaxID=37327 RepID=UPI001C3F4146|nr:hypothetical protein [Nocardia brevicatena]